MAKKTSKAENYERICRSRGLKSLRECKVLSFERTDGGDSIGSFHYVLMMANVPIIIFDGLERGVNVVVKINDEVIKSVRSVAKTCGFVEVTTNLA